MIVADSQQAELQIGLGDRRVAPAGARVGVWGLMPTYTAQARIEPGKEFTAPRMVDELAEEGLVALLVPQFFREMTEEGRGRRVLLQGVFGVCGDIHQHLAHRPCGLRHK